MSEEKSETQEKNGDDGGDHGTTGRVFLVVVDESQEMQKALRFACRRARHTGGRVAMLYVMERNEFQAVIGVGDLMREEARSEAERALQKIASDVQKQSGAMPILYLREGSRRDELMKLISEEPSVSILVLGASTGKGGPGPLVSAFTGRMVGELNIPITIVPGNLPDDVIDELA